mmetsp:Transcript_2794/g.5765  ORF Transcript_2794/g.5765 Transcript_2794/m.5765 type:complete len:187 (+) Transcript_2794:58-618(+)
MAMDLARLKTCEEAHGSPHSGHGEESVSTALSSHSLPNQMTESVSTLTSRPSRRAATTGVSSASRMDQHKRLVRVFLQTNDYLHVNEGKQSWGYTCYPLHTAVRQKKPAVVKALLLLGARRDLKYRGYTPEEYAERRQRRWGGYDDVLKVFEETCGTINIHRPRGNAESEVSAVSDESAGEVTVEL